MDESSIEQALEGYKLQLSQISQILPTADSIEKLELYDLEKDLKELINVTEERLLSIKKEKLLSVLTKEDSGCNTTYSRPPKTEAQSTKNEETNDADEEMDFVGTKCRVKYTQEWGSFQYHNAMVLSVHVPENNEDRDVVKVCVLFLNPIHMSMVPCTYYLDGKCNFSNDECRFSHGYLVNVDELEEFQEPDFSELSVGSKCLAKFDENGVWYKATVDDVHEDQVTVSFDTYKEVVTLDFHSVLPLMSSCEVSSSDEESDKDIDDEKDIGFVQLTYKTSVTTAPLGGWEEHTKGIGSKLMAKMGYIFGKGLGKDGQGRVEPVEIRLLPPGKSLDVIAELREKGFIKDPTKKKKLKPASVQSDSKNTTTSAFDLINQLSHQHHHDIKHKTGSSSHTKAKFSVEESYKLLKKDLSRQKSGDVRQKSKQSHNLNIQMLENSEKISNVKKKLMKQKEALLRNPGSSSVSRTIKQNIIATEHELDELLKVEKSIQDKMHMKNQSIKLTIF